MFVLYDYFGRINSGGSYEGMGFDTSVDNSMVIHFDKASALHYVTAFGSYDCQITIQAKNCLSLGMTNVFGTTVNPCLQSYCLFWWLESKQLFLNTRSYLIVQGCIRTLETWNLRHIRRL